MKNILNIKQEVKQQLSLLFVFFLHLLWWFPHVTSETLSLLCWSYCPDGLKAFSWLWCLCKSQWSPALCTSALHSVGSRASLLYSFMVRHPTSVVVHGPENMNSQMGYFCNHTVLLGVFSLFPLRFICCGGIVNIWLLPLPLELLAFRSGVFVLNLQTLSSSVLGPLETSCWELWITGWAYLQLT